MAAPLPYLAIHRFRLCSFISTRSNKSLPKFVNVGPRNSLPLTAKGLSWDDAFAVSKTPLDDAAKLQGYLAKIQLCNRGAETKSEFIPFLVEGQTVGYVHRSFLSHLKEFRDVFAFPEDNNHGGEYATFHPGLVLPEVRTEAVGRVVERLGEEVIPGIRNELYPVVPSFGKPVCFSLERAAAPYFGIKLGLWSAYEWLCQQRRPEVSVDREEER